MLRTYKKRNSSLIDIHENSARQDTERVFLSGTAILLASIAGNGLSYALGILLARILGVTDFGIYALAITIYNSLTLIVLFGLDIGVIKFVSEALGQRNQKTAAGIIEQAIAIILASSSIASLLLAAFAGILSEKVYSKPALEIALQFLATAIPCAVAVTVLMSGLQAFQIVRYTIIIRYIWEPVSKISLACGFLWMGFGLPGVFSALFITSAISTAVLVRSVHRIAGVQFSNFFTWNSSLARQLLLFCSPLAISSLFGVVAPRSDILLLGYWGSPHEVGTYMAAFQTSAALALILGALDTVLAPIMSRALAEADRYRLRQAYQMASRLTLTLTAPLCAVLVVFGTELLSLFGPEFTVASPVLALLAGAQLIHSMTGTANTVLLMSGYSRIVMGNTIVIGFASIVLMCVLIPMWSSLGAAGASAAGLIALNFVRVAQVWRLHGIHPYSWDLMKPGFAAVSMALALLFAKNLCPPSYYFALLLGGGVLYACTLFLMGLNKGDLAVLQSVRNRISSQPR